MGLNINLEDLPENESSFEPIPAGTYSAEIKAAEFKFNAARTGRYLNLQWSITGENYTGRVIFDMFTIENPSEQAVKIGRQSLRELMEAIGVKSLSLPDDTGPVDQLVGAQCDIRVKVKPAKDGHDARNDVKGYRSNGSARRLPDTSSSAAPAWLRK
jgi:hypothetical protein